MSDKKIEYDPHKNFDAISVIKQADGNWVAEGSRFGKMVRIRGGQPHAVLEALLTHDGKFGATDRIV